MSIAMYICTGGYICIYVYIVYMYTAAEPSCTHTVSICIWDVYPVYSGIYVSAIYIHMDHIYMGIYDDAIYTIYRGIYDLDAYTYRDMDTLQYAHIFTS